ncbi:hypothetical protein SAMN04488040_0673 [Sulfitobacter marinus]|uniref:Uncharacterized protein n=1 Tax=Sulfitobacter marinus TaxID=394264 RepID=A0A1I6QDK9_9RHOB|nr:hypothetical protein [Sulfitobacter marinus]SFS50583.1 hypothetical protein SAMN04488040_0673 [Sulfitobacter marinus]
MCDLNAQLLAAHTARDHGALVGLYRAAAARTHDPNAAGFYLTHAYVFALETDHQDTSALRADLVAQGRETPL